MRGKGRAAPEGIQCLLHPEVLCVVSSVLLQFYSSLLTSFQNQLLSTQDVQIFAGLVCSWFIYSWWWAMAFFREWLRRNIYSRMFHRVIQRSRGSHPTTTVLCLTLDEIHMKSPSTLLVF